MGTSDTKQGQSDTNTAETDDFSAIYKAVLEGNHEELDRLQAVEPVEPKETTEVEKETPAVVEETPATSEVVTETPTPNEGETPSEEETEEEKTEAAKSAASTVDPAKEIEELKRELHRYKSDAGRVAHLQRRQAELEREVRAYKAREVTTAQKDGPEVDVSKAEIPAALKTKIDALREIDPVLAETMEEIAKTTAAVASQKATGVVEVINQQEQEAEDYRFYTEQKQRLTEMVPYADKVFTSPYWKQWKETLSPAKRAMAESGYADEVAVAIHAFTADMQRAYPNEVQTIVPTAPVVKQEAPAQTPENKEALEARQRKMATSTETKSHSAKKTEPFDADQLFREIYKNVAKQNHIL